MIGYEIHFIERKERRIRIDALYSFLKIEVAHGVGELIFCATERRIVVSEEISIGLTCIKFAKIGLAHFVVASGTEDIENSLLVRHIGIGNHAIAKTFQSEP